MDFDKVFGLRKGKGIFLAYDHGIEHGPLSDFKKIESSDPLNILELGKEVNGVVLTPGVIMKYSKEINDNNIKTIAKINSKTSFSNKLYSPITWNVENIATTQENVYGIGYTIYFGSEYEQDMIETFSYIRDIAQEYGLFTFLWAYPRGKGIKKENSLDVLVYAARVGMELGADAIKIKSPDNVEDIKEIKKYIYRTKLFVAGGRKKENFIDFANKVFYYANGLIAGRNLWQDLDRGKRLVREIKQLI